MLSLVWLAEVRLSLHSLARLPCPRPPGCLVMTMRVAGLKRTRQAMWLAGWLTARRIRWRRKTAVRLADGLWHPESVRQPG